MSTLLRTVGMPGAVMMGLGSIVGTGVFVSLGLAAGLAGPATVLALFLAGLLAICNGLSSAQLAAAHPVSGGTYEYGYRYLTPWLGYLAGWLFVCAKSASAATAAIGLGGYLAALLGLAIAPWVLGLAAAALVVGLSIAGLRRSSRANVLIVGVTLATLALYVVFVGSAVDPVRFTPFLSGGLEGLAEATALMFVAYTGYGRIATLGAEVRDPARIIPRAVIVTLAVSFALYMAVAAASIGAVGAAAFHAATVDGAAPLERVADAVGHPWLARLLAFGALTAMLGVLLNLVLGLSRVVFAMGGRGDLPAALATTRGPERTPTPAILVVGIVVIALIALQDVKATWSFSAFTVLVYYALTNLAALRLPADARRYPRVLAWIGLLGCTALAFAVDLAALRLGGALLAAGVAWRLAWINIPGRTGR